MTPEVKSSGWTMGHAPSQAGQGPMMAATRGGTWDVGCWRFQHRWIDRLTAIQVGGSPTGDESSESSSELVADSERFFPSKISQKICPSLIKV